MYWSLTPTTDSPRTREVCHYDEVVERVRGHLLHAARSRLVSDVPVGVFLSGGLDSGAIVSLLAAVGRQPTDALCLDFPGTQFSEFGLADMTASAFGARLQRSPVTAEDFVARLDDFFAVSDQPTTDGFNTYFVSMAARAMGIKVWLSGVGGDELFGGYPSFRRMARLRRLSSILRWGGAATFAKVAVHAMPLNLRLSRVLHLGDRGDSATRAYQTNRNPWPWRNVLATLSPEVGSRVDGFQQLLDAVYPKTGACSDNFQVASAMESQVYMASQLLRDIDNYSMAHSIETRAPFLDNTLFDYVFSLPERVKVNPASIKPLLLDALPLRLPYEVTKGPKRGFTFPIEDWLKGNMRESFERYVFVEENRAYWNLDAIRSMWNSYLRGAVHWSGVWNVYAMARWLSAHCKLQ